MENNILINQITVLIEEHDIQNKKKRITGIIIGISLFLIAIAFIFFGAYGFQLGLASPILGGISGFFFRYGSKAENPQIEKIRELIKTENN